MYWAERTVHSAVGRQIWKTSVVRAENEECVVSEEAGREITILDMQIRMWISDFISRVMNTLEDNDQGFTQIWIMKRSL